MQKIPVLLLNGQSDLRSSFERKFKFLPLDNSKIITIGKIKIWKNETKSRFKTSYWAKLQLASFLHMECNVGTFFPRSERDSRLCHRKSSSRRPSSSRWDKASYLEEHQEVPRCVESGRNWRCHKPSSCPVSQQRMLSRRNIKQSKFPYKTMLVKIEVICLKKTKYCIFKLIIWYFNQLIDF